MNTTNGKWQNLTQILSGIAIAAIVGFAGLVTSSIEKQVVLNNLTDKRLTVLENRYVQYTDFMKTVDKKNSAQTQTIMTLTTSVTLLNDQVDDIKNSTESLELAQKGLTKETTELAIKVDQIDNEVEDLESVIRK